MPRRYFAAGIEYSVAPPPTVAPTYDPATLAWIAAVFAVDGTVVSATQAGYVDTLIVGLKADGLFTKLDRLWLFAIENQTEGLVDIVADQLATNVNSTTFAANRGFTGNGSSMFVDTNLNPSTAGGNFAQNSASIFGWSNTAGTDTGGLFGYASVSNTQLFPEYPDTFCYWCVNGSNGGTEAKSGSGVGATGLYVINRTGSLASQQTLDLNGTSIATGSADASAALPNANLRVLIANGIFSSRQVSCLGFGGSLGTSTDRTNCYNRLRTYMSSVGVP